MLNCRTRPFVAALLSSMLLAKTPVSPGCGTYAGRAQEELHLHRQSERARPAGLRQKRLAAARTANRDVGNIAVMDDADGVIARRNPFNLDGQGLHFIPSRLQRVQL